MNFDYSEKVQKLLYIEYGFHVTLIISVAVAAYCFLSLIREWNRRQAVRSGT